MRRLAKTKCACGNDMSQKAKQCWDCRSRRETRKCCECKTEFVVKPSCSRRTCSRKCAHEIRTRGSRNTQSRKVSLCCKQCGKVRLVSPSYSGRKFCSIACRSAFNTGSNNHSWKGGITAEHAKFFSSAEWGVACSHVWARERGKCQRCVIHSKRGHHVHHIKPWSKFRELGLCHENLALLCVECHCFVHSRRNKNKEFL